MIKRALGLFKGAAGGAAPEDDDDSDEDISARDRLRLERKLLPGGKGATKKAVVDNEVDEEDGEEEEEEEDGSDDAGSDIAMPPEVDSTEFRGKFRCQLCPHKVLLNENAMEAHLLSAGHKRNEKRYEHAKVLGLEAYQEECKQKAEAKALEKEKLAAGFVSKRKQKNFEYWTLKREKQRKMRTSKKHPQNGLTPAEIDEAKRRFQEKKRRRLERRQASGEGHANAKKDAAPAPLARSAPEPAARPPNRKERRAALFGAAGGVGATGPKPGGVAPAEPKADEAAKAKKGSKRKGERPDALAEEPAAKVAAAAPPAGKKGKRKA